LINKIATATGGDPTAYLFETKWAYPIVIIQSVWKNIGWSSIVYMAAISGIDPQLYEAATIDGANKFRQMINITLPSIMPTIAVMLVLKMGRIINVDFEQLFLLSNAMNRSLTEVFELYIYNNGIASGGTQYSYTTAIGMFKSVVSTILVLSANYIVSRKGFEGVM
jgi:putative aldouronate transport system permease protein